MSNILSEFVYTRLYSLYIYIYIYIYSIIVCVLNFSGVAYLDQLNNYETLFFITIF